MKAGDKFTSDNLRAIRPGLGLPPKYYDVLLGKTVERPLRAGKFISWELLK